MKRCAMCVEDVASSGSSFLESTALQSLYPSTSSISVDRRYKSGQRSQEDSAAMVVSSSISNNIMRREMYQDEEELDVESSSGP